MHISKNAASSHWLTSASTFNGAERKLSQFILPHLHSNSTVCDLGSGAGLLGLELSPYVRSVTCINPSSDLVSAFDKQIYARSLTNIRTQNADPKNLSNIWDTILLFFQGGAQSIPRYLYHARDQIIMATYHDQTENPNWQTSRINRFANTSNTRIILDTLNIQYALTSLTLDFSQPFCDLDDARHYAAVHNPSMNKTAIEHYLRNTLECTHNYQFPYYLPIQRKIGLFLIKKKQNPQIIQLNETMDFARRPQLRYYTK